jgi:putative DNA methylase
MTAYKKKLIEVAMPLEAINKASAREKSIRHGHPSTLHLWWARRPLAACRAVLFGQLVDDPSSWPERFPTEQAQEEERKRLFELIEQLVEWKNSTNEYVLNAARFEIARSIAWNRGEEPPAKANPKAVLAYLQEQVPPVYDPFCGGGSIPLEAQRLGLRTYGSDLNPVAVLISKALVEIPPKFAGLPPVNPARDPHKHWKGAQGLAEDVRYYGQWMRDEAKKRIGHLYPEVEVTTQAVREQPSLRPLKGQKLTVIAWLWARTVASPNPAVNGAHVPLVSSFMLSTKDGKKAWVEPVIDASAPDGYRFVVRSGRIAKEDAAKAKAGTKAARGSLTCVLTEVPLIYTYIDDEANAGRMGARLMAIVAEGHRSRIFLAPSQDQEEAALSAQPTYKPEQECLGTFASNAQGRIYGFKTFGDYFTPRQLVALTTFSDLVLEAREKVVADSRAAGLAQGPRLADGGTGIEAYADALTTYLALSGDRIVMTGNNLAAIIHEGYRN